MPMRKRRKGWLRNCLPRSSRHELARGWWGNDLQAETAERYSSQALPPAQPLPLEHHVRDAQKPQELLAPSLAKAPPPAEPARLTWAVGAGESLVS